MATIKSYTNLEQSKKLAEFLPLESADMCWFEGEPFVEAVTGYEEERAETHRQAGMEMYPSWSLAALLGVLPPYLYEWEKGIDFNLYPSVAKKRWWCAGYISQDLSSENKDKFTLITHADNPVDACYEMIIKLNELKML